MGFDFSGHVLRGPRVASTNAVTTSEPADGVVRDIKSVPVVYDLTSPEAPDLVDAWADQYRAAILEGPGTSPTEYLFWAQNTSNLSLVDDPSWWVEDGTGRIPSGSLEVVNTTPVTLEPSTYTDGSDRVVVTDDGGRSISTITHLVVARGDIDDYDDGGWVDPENPSLGRVGSNPYLIFTIASVDQDPDANLVNLTSAQITSLDGGLSVGRGDDVVAVRYTLAPSRFWWTRNDRYDTRFGYNDKTQRWEPFKGSKVINLGRLGFDGSYRLSSDIAKLPVGSYLPGDLSDFDTYSMIRLGEIPDATSTPVAVHPGGSGTFTGIRVLSDQEAEAYDFSTDAVTAGVVGRTSGVLRFNPSYVSAHAGKTVWYSYQDFQEDSDGVVGSLGDEDLFIAPIPGPTDRPIIRFGSRRDLSTVVVETETELQTVTLSEGQVGVALSTGRLKFSDADVDKADPTSSSFSKHYLGEQVIYAGVSLNQTPQPTKAPVRLTGSGGSAAVVEARNLLFVPDSVSLPDEFVSGDPYRGLGRSGILDAPDGTGALPGLVGTPAATRPGGDSLSDPTTGRLREVVTGIGDTFVFSRKGAVKQLEVVQTNSRLPSERRVPEDTVYVSREYTTGDGSQVALGSATRRQFLGDPVYFLQAELTPAIYTTDAKVYSRNRLIFRFDRDAVDGDKLYFAIDGSPYVWEASSLPAQDFYTPDEVADSINSVVVGTGGVVARYGRVCLYGNTSVEIGWGTGGEKDLSGCAALGLLPGWRVVDGVVNWLPDSGVSLGLRRSSVNQDRSLTVPDFRTEVRVTNLMVQESVQAQPFVFFDHPPLQDVAGFDSGVFFSLTSVVTQEDTVEIVYRPLEHYEDIQHRFGEGKFAWLEASTHTGVVGQPVAALSLGQLNVIPETLLNAPGIGGGLYLAGEGGRYTFLKQGQDYLLPDDGASGYAVLSETVGAKVLFGSQGTFASGSSLFVDTSADFRDVSLGYRLKITSGPLKSLGSYRVESVLSTTSLTVSPPFLSNPDDPVTWEIFEGYSEDVFDPSLVSDVVYKEFQHLSEEPFKARVLTLLGLTPESSLSQESSRLNADLAKAVSSGRDLNLRFGLEAPTDTNTSSLYELSTLELGDVINDVLVVPYTDHFQVGAFSILVGSEKFEHDSTLFGTSFLPSDPGGGDAIAYLTMDWVQPDGSVLVRGTLRFGSNILSDLSSARVNYVEEFRDPSDLPSLVAEYNRHTGDINIGESEINTFGSVEVYLVEQMITEERKDVALSPMLGAFTLMTPLDSGQVVEVSYYRADLEGRRTGDLITEFLSVFIRDEVTERQSSNIYTFNSAGKTIDDRYEPVVYIGPVQQNFGTIDYSLDYLDDGTGEITFLEKDLAEYIEVTVSYAVLEASGGERAFDASNRPVYRPPFFIKEGISEFGLRGDRTGDFEVGQMLRVGNSCFYITHVTYYPVRFEPSDILQVNPKGDVTGVGIFPPTTVEVGSRSPGNDLVNLITDRPIAVDIDPDGSGSIAAGGAPGFWRDLSVDDSPFEPVNRGQASVVFLGDLSSMAVAGHILEMGGKPYTISQVALSEDGTRTEFTITASFLEGLSVGDEPTVRLSYRPVYPPGVRDFVGSGPIVPTEATELVLFGEEDPDGNQKPGRTLIPNLQYTIDANSGAVRLLGPFQDPQSQNQTLYLSFTRQTLLQAYLSDGVVVYPRYSSNYRFNTIPSDDNGYLGGILYATYTYSNPDIFYVRATSLRSFLVEAVEDAIDVVTNQTPAGGPVFAVSDGEDNWEKGRLGLLSSRRNLEDLDRAGRVFLDFYNTVCVSFEQINETISGGFVGDRHGKFRFFVGRGKEYAPPGYEDQITGRLNLFNVFSSVFNSADKSRDITFVTSDSVVDPEHAVLTDGVLDGPFLDPDSLDTLVQSQYPAIRNDVDDLVLVGLDRPVKVKTPGIPPYYRFQAGGVYDQMYGTHFFSRIFPRATKAFLTTLPGIGYDGSDPGVYSAGVVIDGRSASTAQKSVGQLANPVLGDITDVVNATMFRRRARARVWGYFDEGLPEGAFDLDGLPSPAISRPCVIATPVPLGDLPINPSTGYPDHTKFISEGGDLIDLVSGDPDLSTPPFSVGDQITWGKPDGTFYRALNSGLVATLPVGTVWTGVFVEDVLYGCVLVFQDGDDPASSISSVDTIYAGTDLTGGILARKFVSQGDTISVEAAVNYLDPPTGDPPTSDELLQAARQSDNFRMGFDLDVRQDGSVLDLSLPSSSDGVAWGLKEILGQNSPGPLTPLEGDVQFIYMSQLPLRIPALDGIQKDDSGDYHIPYLRTVNTELDRFGEASAGLALVMSSVGASGGYVYPDEIVGDDGRVIGAFSAPDPPAALLTTQDLLPVTSGSTDLGVGDARPYDILLVEVDPTPSPEDPFRGILSVGGLDHTYAEPPRFVTSTTPPTAPSPVTGSNVKYVLDNAIVWIDRTSGYPDAQTVPSFTLPGLEIDDDAGTGFTRLVFSSIGGGPSFNEGVSGIGNLNNVVNGVWPNVVQIDILGRLDTNIANGPGPFPFPNPPWPEGRVILSLLIEWNQVTVIDYTGAPGVTTPHGGVIFGTGVGGDEITIQANGFIPWGPGPGIPDEWFIPHLASVGPRYQSLYGYEFSVSVDTFTNPTAQSETAYIDEDRLTFVETCDFRFARERGFTHPQQPDTDLETKLLVHEVSTPFGFSTVNRDVNGGVPFTFLPRSVVSEPGLAGGMWRDASTPPEKGILRVMGFEGHGNTPITAMDLKFSVVPSSDEYAFGGGDICKGTGVTESKVNTSVPDAEIYDDRITEITLTSGLVINVEPGDVLTIPRSSNSTHWATHKAGTYLVHQAVEDNTGSGYQQISPSSQAGIPGGWSEMVFPHVIVFSPGTLEVSDTTGYETSGTLYVLASLEGVGSSVESIFQYSVLVASYTGITGNTFTGLSGYQLADGTAISATDFGNAISPGMLVSGRVKYPVDFTGQVAGNVQSRNLVGWEGAGATKGFRWLTLRSEYPGTTDQVFDGTSDIDSSLPPVPGNVGVEVGTVPDNGIFTNDPDRILYPDVVVEWGLNLSSSQWRLLNIPPTSWGFTHSTVVECLLPGTRVELTDGAGVMPGLHVQSGIFLEPSFPRQVFDLSVGGPHVVDRDYSLTSPPPSVTAEIGMRNSEDYLIAPTVLPEEVYFEVRRIRRFHDVNRVVGKNIKPLRFAYEIRRGRFTSYSSNDKQYGIVVADGFTMDWESTKLPATSPRAPDVWNEGGTYTGTNLGGFDDSDVNIHPGDIFRVLDGEGNVVDEAFISSIDGPSTLRLSPPGLTASLPLFPGQRFEIFLQRAPVPHEQTGEQLLDLITDRVVHQTFADDSTEQGGYVPASTADTNHLFDDLNAPGGGSDFQDLGVRRGDIVVIDPHGTMPNGETGSFPLGDLGVSGRALYTPGGPAALDDNRGWYRVVSVEPESGDPPHLVVSGETTFTGTDGDDVTFPDDAVLSGLMGYAVYPTIGDSGLTAGTEGQMDLRPTEVAIAGSHSSNFYSIRPFSYKVIRPSSLFSVRSIDLALSFRERILSLIQLYRGVLTGEKSGNYFVFQLNGHAQDLGDPTDFLDGKGVLSNDFIESLVGEVGKSPYYNSSSCLAFLDRRFWIHDSRLDSLVPESNVESRVYDPVTDPAFPNSLGPYTAYTNEDGATPGASVLPVLPGRVDEVLDQEDRFRPIRYTWLAYRTHKVLGTLASIDRLDQQFDSLMEEQQRLLDIQQASEDEL